jgi:protoheme IX farnesyltransferase
VKKIKILSLINLACSIALVLMGAYVNASGATFSCPEWPTCFGSFAPIGTANSVTYHLVHRILGMIVGALSLYSVVLAVKSKKPMLRKKVIGAFIFVLTQGAVGALAAIYKLPTIIAVLHLGLSLIFIYYQIRIYLLASEKPVIQIEDEYLKSWSPLYYHLYLLSGGLYFLQTLIGALIKHAGASRACGVATQSGPLCFESASQLFSWWPKAEPAQLHISHRYFALLVLIAFLYSCHFLFHFLKNTKLKKTTAQVALMPLLLIAQVTLGITSLKYNLESTFTYLHFINALATVLIFSFSLEGMRNIQELLPEERKHSILSDFFDLSKPRLTLLVVCSSFIGLVLAPEKIGFFKALLGLFSILLVVIGAATLNCYLEREVDGQMDRTKNRPLPSGRMSSQTALAYGAITSLLGLGILFFKFNMAVGLASAFSTFSYVFAYTPLKTKSTISLFVGAIPGAIPPLLGYLLVTSELNLAVITVFLLIFFWQFPHFFSISIFHGKDYAKANIQVHTNKISFDASQKFILYSTPFVVLISYLPLFNNPLQTSYFYAATLLGLAFIYTAFIKERDKVDFDSRRLWARRYFFASIIYLPLVMFSMVLLR